MTLCFSFCLFHTTVVLLFSLKTLAESFIEHQTTLNKASSGAGFHLAQPSLLHLFDLDAADLNPRSLAEDHQAHGIWTSTAFVLIISADCWRSHLVCSLSGLWLNCGGFSRLQGSHYLPAEAAGSKDLIFGSIYSWSTISHELSSWFII